MNTYWISFATDNPGSKNLGVCIVDAETIPEAIQKTIELKINPGGEAMVMIMPPENPQTQKHIAAFGKNKLIQEEELLGNGAIRIKEESPEMQKRFYSSREVHFICEKCNSTFPHTHNHD